MADNKLRVARLQRIGDSHGITIPAEFLRAIGAARGDLMRVELHGQLIEVRNLNEKTVKIRRAANKSGPGDFLGKD